MQAKLGVIAIAAALALSACGEREPQLYNLRSDSGGPDEFAILPTKPLEMPEDMAALPDPTPGGSNRADATPEADAYAALGGNPEAVGQLMQGGLLLVQPALLDDGAGALVELRQRLLKLVAALLLPVGLFQQLRRVGALRSSEIGGRCPAALVVIVGRRGRIE